MMKAFVLRSYGSPDLLELTDLDEPVPADDEVLVRVRATSINPYDWHIMRGQPYIARLMPGALGLRGPKLRILGCDIAGQVAAAGQQATGFSPGDQVYALLPQGGFAEYVSVPQHLLASRPKNLSCEQAAAVPMAAITALLGLRDQGRLKPGQKVLSTGPREASARSRYRSPGRSARRSPPFAAPRTRSWPAPSAPLRSLTTPHKTSLCRTSATTCCWTSPAATGHWRPAGR